MGERGWAALPVSSFPTSSSSLHTPARPHTSCPLFRSHFPAPPRLQPGLGHRGWAPRALSPSRGRHVHRVASHSRTQVEVAAVSLQPKGPGHWLPPPTRPLPSIHLTTLAAVSSCLGSTKPATCDSSPWGSSSFPAPLREASPASTLPTPAPLLDPPDLAPGFLTSLRPIRTEASQGAGTWSVEFTLHPQRRKHPSYLLDERTVGGNSGLSWCCNTQEGLLLGEPITSQAILCGLFLGEYFHLYQCFDFLKYFYLEIVELLKKQRVKKKRNRELFHFISYTLKKMVKNT